jgi:ATP-dependent Clp protease ATP-binding subunit ClpC
MEVTRLFSDATRELLQRAAQTAAEWGILDLDTDHLLFGALSDEVVVHVLEQAGANPKAMAAQIEDEADRGKPVDVSPSLSPDAKRAILSSYDEARELGASYIGPEHILLSLARDEDAEAGRILRRFGLSHTQLRGLVVRGVDREGQPTTASTTKTLDQYSRDLTALAREGKLRPRDRTRRRDRTYRRDPLAPDEEQPCADRRPRCRQDRHRRRDRPAHRERRGA